MYVYSCYLCILKIYCVWSYFLVDDCLLQNVKKSINLHFKKIIYNFSMPYFVIKY